MNAPACRHCRQPIYFGPYLPQAIVRGILPEGATDEDDYDCWRHLGAGVLSGHASCGSERVEPLEAAKAEGG